MKTALVHEVIREAVLLNELADLKQCEAFMQHGDVSVLLHCVAVAMLSLHLLEITGVSFDRRALIRGALLHDYFLYDWHTPKKREKGEKMHAFAHPLKALENAKKRVTLTEKEEDIIVHHMFPVTLALPQSREAAIVCAADKLCAAYETLAPHPYAELRRICAWSIRER